MHDEYGFSNSQNRLANEAFILLFGEYQIGKNDRNEISKYSILDNNRREFKDEELSLCDIGFAILSAPKYFKSRVENLKNSWIRHLCRIENSNDSSSNFALIASEKHGEIPTIIPNCEENYLNLCCKTLASFKWMVDNWPEKKWYMKLDDDTFVILSTLVDELSSLNSNENYLVGGQIYLTLEDSIHSQSSRSNTLHWKDRGEVIKGIRGGAGYLMTRSLAKLFVNNGKRYLDICNNGGSKFKTFEDASVSLLVTELVGQRSIMHIPGFHFHKPEISYRSGYDNRGFRPVTFHMMHDTSNMEFLDYLLNGPLRPSTYSCSHESTNSCVSSYDLSISSKYWEPVYFGALNSENSKILGKNAIKIREEGSPQLKDKSIYSSDISIENNNLLPTQKSTLLMSYPKYYTAANVSVTEIFDNYGVKSGNTIASLQMKFNSLETEHPCKRIIETHSRTLKNYYKDVLSGVEEILFIGFPDHPNRGDSAIFTGALILLEYLEIKIIKAIHLLSEYNQEEILSLFTVEKSKRAIIFHGGGNFGDLYSHHHQLRYVVLNDFSNYKIVMFPQTVFFRDKENKMITINNFIKHKGELFLAGRDKSSAEILREMFEDSSNIHTELLPDLAFLIGDQRKRRGIPSLDILIHARVDNEGPNIFFNGTSVKMSKVRMENIKKVINDGVKNKQTPSNYQNIKNSESLKSEWTDYLSILVDDWLESDANYNELINTNYIERSISRTLDGMAFLSRANIIITNRLHGHILLLLLGVPHFVMGDSFGKLMNFRESWTSECKLSTWYDDFTEALVDASGKLNNGL
ncbi:pyruvyl transferase Pvg1 [Cryptosporidium felis]|nr:pyruvyl transferase Pvg1 [Cryptosporidium felis]